MSYFERLAEVNFFFTYREMEYTSPHFHSGPEFIFVERGEVEAIVNGEKRTLQAGDACFVDGFCVHSYGTALDSRSFVLLLRRQFFEKFLPYFNDGVPPRFFRFENYALLDFLRDICREKYENEGSRYAAFEGAVAILLASISKTTPFVPRQKDKSAALVCSILRYAEENIGGDLSVRALAKKFGYSYEYLSRTLTKTLNERWSDYINRLRIRKAHERLQTQPDAPVIEIANECGFESPNTFYRAYKKEYGFPPRRRE